MEASPANSPSERGSKSPGAFRTISEVADDLDVPQHVLRFWESKFSQVKPLKRGGGRRYYRPEDVDLLRGIRRLLYTDGYTIKGVQKLLRDHGTRAIRDAGRGVGVIAPVPAEAGEKAAAAATSPAGDTTLSRDERLSRVIEELNALHDMLQSRRS